jgi:hypothetical protein
MKAKFLSLFRPIVYISLGLSLVFSCQKINPLDGIELTVNNDVYKSPILIEFVDANSNSTVIPKDLTVTISGPNKDLILNDLGGKDFKVAGNLLSLVLAETVNPTEDAPVEFTVSVKGPNYAPTNYTITIVDFSNSTYRVALTNLSALPDGVKSVAKTTSLTTGETIVIPATTDKPEVAKITIPAGTQVKDETGAVINATSVNSNIIQYGTGTEDAFNSFPNEGEANTVKFKDGTTDEASFITAGFVDIEMTAGGKNVKSFSKPLDMTLSLHPDLVNPETEEPVQVGEQIPVFSYDRDKDEWTEEGDATITKDANGNLIANFKVPHLSTWTIAWKYKGKTCGSKTYTVTIKSNIKHSTSGYYAKVSYVKGGKVRYSKKYPKFNISNKTTLKFKAKKVPKGYTTRIVVYGSNGVVIGSSSFNACTNKSIVMIVKDPKIVVPPNATDEAAETESDAIKVNLDFTAACTNKNVNIKPTVWIKLVDDAGVEQLVNVVGGKAILAMKKNTKYQITATYDGKNYSGEVTINNSTAMIVSSVGLTGSFPIDPASGEVNAKLIYPLNNCK